MKKFNFILIAALASFAALSCQKESFPKINEDTNPESELVPLTLSTGESTKTHISGNQILWDSSDAIKVFTDEEYELIVTTNAFDFKMSSVENGGTVARFTGEIAKGATKIWAVYPSAQAESCSTSGDNFIVKLPSLQTPTPGSFDPMANVSVAKTTIEKNGSIGTYEPSANVNFKNVGSLLKFTIPQGVTNISSVTLTADAPIAGKLKLDFTGDAPTLEMNESGDYIINEAVNSIQMKKLDANGNKVYFADNQTYWFVLAPIKVKKLSLFIDTDNKQYGANFSFPSSTQLNPGEYKNLGILNISSWPSFEVNYSVRDEGGVLNGTDVVFNFPRNDVSHIDLTVTKEGASSPCRTINITNPELNSNNQYVSTYDDQSWPYLPKGRYFVSGEYTTSDGVVEVRDYSFVIDTDPIFSVGDYEAYTSWTLFKSGKVDEANNSNGLYIYFTVDQSSISISDKILKNANYNDIISVSFSKSDNEIAKGFFNTGSASVLVAPVSGAYSAPAYNFDSVRKEFNNMTCNVTGIPHTANPPTKDLGWTTPSDTDVVIWNSNDVQLWGAVSEPVISSPKVYLPENTKVALKVEASLYSFAAAWQKNLANIVVRANGQELINQYGEVSVGLIGTGSKTVNKSLTFNDNLSSGTYSVDILNTNRFATSVTVKEYQLKYSK